MEYAQTVLFRIPAARVDDSDRLFAELEAHRDFASSQRGFNGMRITRTANPEGDVLVVVETRWTSNNAMADYSAQPTNVESIVEAHPDLVVAGSVEVHRMQADRAEKAEAPTRMYDRLALALFVPAGILAFALLVIYGLSRIYLALGGEWATVMAAAVALLILGAAWYFASNPNLPRWQWMGAAAVAILALGIGGIGAAIYDEQNAEEHAPPVAQPTTPPDGEPPPPAGEVVLNMGDNFFELADGGEQNPTLQVASGTTIQLQNIGSALHNMHVSPSGDTFAAPFCTPGGEAPCSDPPRIASGESGVIEITLDAGTYTYRCDFHTQEMVGSIEVQ